MPRRSVRSLAVRILPSRGLIAKMGGIRISPGSFLESDEQMHSSDEKQPRAAGPATLPAGQDEQAHAQGMATPGLGDTPGPGPEKWAPVFEEVSTRTILRWLADQNALATGERGGFTTEDQHEFRPRHRPPVPVLTVLDDGDRLEGEMVRLRSETLAIGRSVGDLTLPNDIVISQAHAEIRRLPWRGGYQWHLVDLGSRNGTFVRCARAVLHGEAILILGNRRFRLRNPLSPRSGGPPSEHTQAVDGSQILGGVWPVLEETTGGVGRLRFELRNDQFLEFTLGRTGGQAAIQIDDPLLAYNHAVLRRLRDGSWMISAEQTRNGVWVSISDVVLTNNCSFRCGEQRFRFTIS